MFRNIWFVTTFAIFCGSAITGCGSQTSEEACRGLNGSCNAGADNTGTNTSTTGTDTGSGTETVCATNTATTTGTGTTATIAIPSGFTVGAKFMVRFTASSGSIFAEFDSATVKSVNAVDGSYTIQRGDCDPTDFGCGAVMWNGAGTISPKTITLNGVKGLGTIPYACGGDIDCFAGGTWNDGSFAGTFTMASR